MRGGWLGVWIGLYCCVLLLRVAFGLAGRLCSDPDTVMVFCLGCWALLLATLVRRASRRPLAHVPLHPCSPAAPMAQGMGATAAPASTACLRHCSTHFV